MAATRARWDRAAACRARSYFGFRLGKLFLEIRRLLADIEPIEERVRGFQPNAEPVGNFDFLGALAGFNLGIASNHFGTALTKPRHVQDTLDSGTLAVLLELTHKLVETHDAQFGIGQRFKMEQVLELFLVLFFGLFLLRQHNAEAGALQNIGNVIRGGFSLFTMIRNQAAAHLLDFGGSKFLSPYGSRGLQNHRLL